MWGGRERTHLWLLLDDDHINRACERCRVDARVVLVRSRDVLQEVSKSATERVCDWEGVGTDLHAGTRGVGRAETSSPAEGGQASEGGQTNELKPGTPSGSSGQPAGRRVATSRVLSERVRVLGRKEGGVKGVWGGPAAVAWPRLPEREALT